MLEVDDVVVCAGQESVRGLYDELVGARPDRRVHIIGGADVAAELDAKRAIEQGMRLAADACMVRSGREMAPTGACQCPRRAGRAARLHR